VGGRVERARPGFLPGIVRHTDGGYGVWQGAAGLNGSGFDCPGAGQVRAGKGRCGDARAKGRAEGKDGEEKAAGCASG
jgi:hypothetical protein